MPRRVQRRRTKGWRMPDGAVYVGRGTTWGNPFPVGEAQVRYPYGGEEWEHEGRSGKTPGQVFFCTGTDERGMPVGHWDRVAIATTEQVLTMYREYITGGGPRTQWKRPSELEAIRANLAGKDLACWCPEGQPCHADVLLELANR